MAAVTVSLGVAAVTVGHALQSSSPGAPDFTEEQVERGEQVYVNHCQQCHGDQLQGANAPALVGESFEASWLSGEELSELYEKISKQMPFRNPGSLSEEQYLDVTSFVLAQNGYEPTGTALSTENLDVELQPPGGDGAGTEESADE